MSSSFRNVVAITGIGAGLLMTGCASTGATASQPVQAVPTQTQSVSVSPTASASVTPSTTVTPSASTATPTRKPSASKSSSAVKSQKRAAKPRKVAATLKATSPSRGITGSRPSIKAAPVAAKRTVTVKKRDTCATTGYNIPKSSPRYRSYLDTNHDGISCGRVVKKKPVAVVKKETSQPVAKKVVKKPVSDRKAAVVKKATSRSTAKKVVKKTPNSGVSYSVGTSPNAARWNRIAQCESGGNWSINTGNGYYGGLQFSRSTWLAFGGGKYAPTANKATKDQQMEIADKVLKVQGWGAWPVCSRR